MFKNAFRKIKDHCPSTQLPKLYSATDGLQAWQGIEPQSFLGRGAVCFQSKGTSLFTYMCFINTLIVYG